MNRRKFVKKSFLFGAGLLACYPAFSAARGSNKVKLGIVGSGNRGQGILQLLPVAEHFQVVALADILPFRLNEAKAYAPTAACYRDHRQLLENKDVDAVIIATPMNSHEEIAIDALRANKHVYCEKTLVKGMAGIQNVLKEVANKSNLVFQTGHQYRSSPLYNEVKNMVQSGYIGDVTAIHCQWNRNNNWRKPLPDPSLEEIINWRLYRKYSGGLVSELMSHQLDFVNWVANSLPDRISAFGGVDHWKDGRDTPDNVHAIFEYPSGLDASFTCTTTNGFEDFQIKILGSAATIVMQRNHARIYIEPPSLNKKTMIDGVTGATAKAWEKGLGAPIETPGTDPTLDALKQFYHSIADGGAVASGIDSGANTAKCVQLTLDALYNEKIVHWRDYPELVYSPNYKYARHEKRVAMPSVSS